MGGGAFPTGWEAVFLIALIAICVAVFVYVLVQFIKGPRGHDPSADWDMRDDGKHYSSADHAGDGGGHGGDAGH